MIESVERFFVNLTTPAPNETPEGKWHQEQVESHKKSLRSDPDAPRPKGMSREVDAETRSSIEHERNMEDYESGKTAQDSDRLYNEIKDWEDADYEMARGEIEEMAKTDEEIRDIFELNNDEKDEK